VGESVRRVEVVPTDAKTDAEWSHELVEYEASGTVVSGEEGVAGTRRGEAW
jgi:hypothetical protein